MIKIAIAFVTGVCVGCASTYVFLKKKYDQQTEEEIEEVRQYYQEKKEDQNEQEDNLNIKIVEALNEYASEKSFEEKMAESEFPEEDVMTQEDSENDAIYQETLDDPKIITMDEYEAYPYFDKIELQYFTDDKILAEEDGEIVKDPELLIGNALTKYGFDQNGELVIHVRNGKISTDFEIIKMFGSHYDTYET